MSRWSPIKRSISPPELPRNHQTNGGERRGRNKAGITIMCNNDGVAMIDRATNISARVAREEGKGEAGQF